MTTCQLCQSPLHGNPTNCPTCGNPTSAPAPSIITSRTVRVDRSTTDPPQRFPFQQRSLPASPSQTPSSPAEDDSSPPDLPTASDGRRRSSGAVELTGTVSGAPTSRFRSLSSWSVTAAFVALVGLGVALTWLTDGVSLVLIPVAVVLLVATFALQAAASILTGRKIDGDSIEIVLVRVMDDNGDTHDCRVVGSIDSGLVRSGDRVTITGRRNRDRSIRVRRMVNKRTNTNIKTTPPVTHWIVYGSRLILAVVVVLLLVVAAVYATEVPR